MRDELLHERQADTRLRAFAPRVRHTTESLEDVRQLFAPEFRRRCPAPRARRRRDPRNRDAIPPSNVCLNAFESRLRTIFSHMSAIDEHRWASGGRRCELEARPFERRAKAGESVVYAAEVGRLEHGLDAPGLDAGEVEERVDELEQPMRVAMDQFERARDCAASSPGPRRSSAGPRISVSGVRSSWLTLEKKSVFARSSSARLSARRRSASYARALARLAAIWPPISSTNPSYDGSS